MKPPPRATSRPGGTGKYACSWLRATPAFVLFVSSVTAAPPSLDYVFPSGAPRGAPTTVTFAGKLEAGAKVWTDDPALVFKPTEKAGEYIIEPAKDARPGARLVRVYNEEGASVLKPFVVGTCMESSEKEPNDGTSSAHHLDPLPITLNGQLEKPGDVDSFALALTAGQTLVARMDARTLGSPVDAMLRLLDPAGAEVAFGHDHAGLDPLLVYRATKPGTYTLQLSGFAYPPAADVRFTGAKTCVYRLSLTTGPYALYAFPHGLRRGASSSLHLFGVNLPDNAPALVRAIDATKAKARQEWLDVVTGGVENTLRLPLGDHADVIEAEPNDKTGNAQPVTLPATINGRSGTKGDEDRFTFTARKGDVHLFTLRSGSLGFPMDAMVRVEDAKGQQLAANDDAGERQDASLNWTAPADGTYAVVVRDLMGRGGEDFVYRLEAARPTPTVEGKLEVQSVTIAAGGSAELKVTVARKHGHAAPIVALVKGLPAGVSATAPEVPAGGGAVTIKLTAAADAKPHSGEVRVLLVSTDPDNPSAHLVTIDLRPKEPANELLVEEAEGLWVTVTAAKKP